MSILIVTGIEGALNCAAAVGAALTMEVQVAEGRKQALAAMRRAEFDAVVVDESLAECDPAAADAIWERAGLAIPLQINFAISGAARLTRESGPLCTGANVSGLWLIVPQQRQSIRNSKALWLDCCCTPNWRCQAAMPRRQFRKNCAWLRSLWARCANN